jgi:hypothetical protein
MHFDNYDQSSRWRWIAASTGPFIFLTRNKRKTKFNINLTITFL